MAMWRQNDKFPKKNLPLVENMYYGKSRGHYLTTLFFPDIF